METTKFTRLGNWLAQYLGAGFATLSDATRMAGGAIQENWGATLVVSDGAKAGTHQVVLRSDAPSGLSFSHDRAQEFSLLTHAFKNGVQAPEPLAYCADASVFGQPVMIMARVDGTASAHRLVKSVPDAADGDALVYRIGAELARLHACAPWPDLPSADPVARRVTEFDKFLDNHRAPQPVLRFAVRWMHENAPVSKTNVPCHYDFRNGNIMIGDNQVSGILDWEFSGNGDPHEDLGWFCAACWRFGRQDRAAGGLGARKAFYAGYESVSSYSVDDAAVRYWEIVGLTRWCIIALAQTERFTSGEERSLELGLTGLMQPHLQEQLLTYLRRPHDKLPAFAL